MARMAVEIAPHFVVNHFTLANVYIAMVTAAVTPLLLLFFADIPSVFFYLPSSEPHHCIVCPSFSCHQEEFEKAMRWYESTLKLQPEFAPAKDRLRTIQCYLLTKRERRQP